MLGWATKISRQSVEMMTFFDIKIYLGEMSHGSIYDYVKNEADLKPRGASHLPRSTTTSIVENSNREVFSWFKLFKIQIAQFLNCEVLIIQNCEVWNNLIIIELVVKCNCNIFLLITISR